MRWLSAGRSASPLKRKATKQKLAAHLALARKERIGG
jgi:hypothetical protein